MTEQELYAAFARTVRSLLLVPDRALALRAIAMAELQLRDDLAALSQEMSHV